MLPLFYCLMPCQIARLLPRWRWQSLWLACLACLASVFIALGPVSSLAQTPTSTAADQATVVFNGQPLFQIQGSQTADSVEVRADRIAQRIEALAKEQNIPLEAISVSESELGSVIYAEDRLIMTVSDQDAIGTGLSRQALAAQYRNKVKTQVEVYRLERSAEYLSRVIGLALGGTVLLVLAILVLANVMPQLDRWLDRQQDRWIPSVRIQNFELLTSRQLTGLVQFFTKVLHFTLVAGLLWFYLSYVLSLFPQTRRLGKVAFGYLTKALQITWQEFVGYLPNLLSIILIVFLTTSFLRFARWFSVNIQRQRLQLPGFYPEWALPSYRIVQFLTLAFALAVIFPYLPGADSPAFQGVSIFLGLLVSLGAGGIIFSVVAGFILVFTRAFTVGDRIRLGEIEGFVEEKSLLVTRLRTIENILVSIPNAALLSNNIVNYTALVREKQMPLVVKTTITLGYDLPWRKVYTALIDAANNTSKILADPAPEVWQTSLDDFYVSYQLRAFTHHPEDLGIIYTELHQNIQDCCNAAGIEIMSPHYAAMRDGNQSTIPADYLPSQYQAPPWNLPPFWPSKPDNSNQPER